MKTILHSILALGLALVLVACNSSDNEAEVAVEATPDMKTITGTVTYVEDIILAPESHAMVELVDITDPKSEPVIIADAFIHARGRPPLEFAIEYDANLIQPDRDYAVRSHVTEQTRLMFMSTDSYPVFVNEQEAPHEILLKRVPNGQIDRMSDVVRAKNPELLGYYYWFDGEGEFVDCEDESIHPVAKEKGVYGLERGYRREASKSGDLVFTRLIGNYVTRPARSGGGKEDYLVVIQVEEMDGTGSCP